MKKLAAILIIITVFGCKKVKKTTHEKLNVVTTTTMITDLVSNIAGDLVNIEGLMGSGVDPHLFKASAGDVTKLSEADVIFYNGLHLEGKLVEVFEKMQSQNINTKAIGEIIDTNTLIGSEYFQSNYDPHIWFNIDYWMQATNYVVDELALMLPEHKEQLRQNGDAYLDQLKQLQASITSTIETLAPEKRILVTAHDAFNYFGKSYDFEVVGLQGLSTATEAGVQDVQKLAAFIIEKQIKAIFVESSVPKRTIEALKEAVNAKGHNVVIGGTLYSDALGSANTPEGTYIGMFTYNVKTIVEALQ
ncbi:MAG: manganese transporter [Bacteroidetes bacterium MedPE-SWsnd-G2]|nr:MAG: manganese transporter [Bacteroidetes bacterium MedPE-SWsnd-G2]